MPPLYTYEHPETKERIELLQSINDCHQFELAGVIWDRVWDVFTIGAAKIDPNSVQDFLDKTSKGGTIGDLWDRSAELSAMRAEKNNGVDPIAEKKKEKQREKDIAQVERRRAAIRKAKKEKK